MKISDNKSSTKATKIMYLENLYIYGSLNYIDTKLNCIY